MKLAITSRCARNSDGGADGIPEPPIYITSIVLRLSCFCILEVIADSSVVLCKMPNWAAAGLVDTPLR
jgi:hypothetical protein